MGIKKEKLYILAALLVLVLFFEGASRLVLSSDFIFNKIASFDDSSFRLKWIRDHRGTEEIYYKFDIYDPTKGWISKPGLRNEKVFDGKILNTNSRGLRGAVDHAYGRHPEKLRVLVLGDSYTFGDEVSDNETYPYYLQQMLKEAEVINIGVHGYGHDQMLILLKEEGVKYMPDVIVLGFVYLDVYRNNVSFRDYAKPEFDVKDGDLVLREARVPSPEELLKWEWARPKLYDLYNIFRNWVLYNRYSVRYGLFEKKRERLTHGLTSRILDEVAAVSASVNAKPVFVYLPLKKEVEEGRDLTEGESYLFDYCGQNKEIGCFSARPYLEKERELDKQYMPSRHYSPSGNRVVAGAIREFLAGSGELERVER